MTRQMIIDYLESIRIDLICACECDGRGCTMCEGCAILYDIKDHLRRKWKVKDCHKGLNEKV